MRPRAGAGALFFLAAFALFTATHVASLYLDDSGETVTAAVLLGIPHPPGYPLHTLLTHLAGFLPLGSPAEPINLLAGALAAACATAVFLLLAGARGTAATVWDAAAAAVAAGLLCVGPVFWHNALVAKGSVYQLNNLLSVALLAVLAAPSLSPRRVRAFWLLLGLAFAHHYMSQLPLLPAYGWLLWRGCGRRAAGGAWLAAAGGALYLFIPLRASLHPGLNWGGVRSFRDFWFFFSRMQYAAGEVTRSPGTSLSQCLYALGQLLREGGGLALPAAAVASVLGRRDARVQALTAGWLASVAAVTFYLNLSADRLDIMQPYLFPAYLCQVLLAGGLLQAGLARLARAGRLAAMAGAGAALVALGAAEWPAVDLSDYFFAVDSARGLLTALPPRALLLCQGDAVIFPLWYLQRVRHERTDVATVGLAVLPMDWVRDELARSWPDLRHPLVRGPVGAESVPALTQAYLELNPQRPLFASFNQLDPGIHGWNLESAGEAFRCVRSADALPVDLTTVALTLQAVPLRGYTRRPVDARTLKLVIGDMGIRYNALGILAEDAKEYALALDFYRRAVRVSPESSDFVFNEGNALYELGRLPEAAEAFGRSVAVDPGYINGWYNRGVTLYQYGQKDEARLCFQKVYALDHNRSDVIQVLRQMGANPS